MAKHHPAHVGLAGSSAPIVASQWCRAASANRTYDWRTPMPPRADCGSSKAS